MVVSVQTLPTAHILRLALRANLDHGFIYLNNPKVGCTSIKAALWSGVTGTLPPSVGKGAHELEGAPFVNWLDDVAGISEAFVFTAVRNPFQRIVSAYLDKIAPASGEIWQTFLKQAGLPEGPVSFDLFIEVLTTLPPERLDPHWRPQYLNTLHPFVMPNLVVDLEALDRMLPDAMAQLFPGKTVEMPGRRQRSHGTDARVSWRSHMADPATLARVLDIFEVDFACFGYTPSLQADTGSARPVHRSDHRQEGLAALMAFWAAPSEEKSKRLRALEALDKGGNLAAFILSHRLGFNRKNPTKLTELLAENADLLPGAPALLRHAVEVAMADLAEAQG